MTYVIDAVYESGVLNPLEKIDLKEGTQARTVIKDAFGLLKGTNTAEALKEMDDAWCVFVDPNVFLKNRDGHLPEIK